jgi:hypothetical protein
MGNRYGPRADEFEWTLGARRRLLRYLQQAHLTYAECALLLGCSRGSVAAMTARLKLPRLTPEERKEARQRRAYEAAIHGRRERASDDSRFIEPWHVFHARKQKEREAAKASLQVGRAP